MLHIQPLGMNCEKMMIEEYCSRSELRAMEQEIWSLTMKGDGYFGKKPLCDRCKMHHTGPCIDKCGKMSTN